MGTRSGTRSWLRRRWWLIALAVLALLELSDRYEPDWYAAESATMEEISQLINAPVPYRRGGSGFGSSRHVSNIVLPPVSVDREDARRLAKLVRELSECHTISCAFVPNQTAAIQGLNEELGGHAVATHDLGASSKTVEEMQRETYVAGIHRGSDFTTPLPFEQRPLLAPSNPPPARTPD
jgi:hypothetical protein